MRRTLRALPFMMVWPMLTWPSPAITTLPPLRTVTMVVACMVNSFDIPLLRFRTGPGRQPARYEEKPSVSGALCMRGTGECKWRGPAPGYLSLGWRMGGELGAHPLPHGVGERCRAKRGGGGYGHAMGDYPFALSAIGPPLRLGPSDLDTP